MSLRSGQKLRELCETRWSARGDALYTFLASFDVVVDALSNLIDEGDTKAQSHLNNMLSFSFIICLVTAEHLIQSTTQLSKLLQLKSIDLVEAVKEANVVKELLQSERNDDTVWDELYAKAEAIANKHDVVIQSPRNAQRQRHRVNVPADNVPQYYKRAVFYPFLEHLVAEITDRLLVPENRFHAQALIPSRLQELTNQKQADIAQHYGVHLPHFNQLDEEIKRWKTRWQMSDVKPDNLSTTLEHTNPVLFPNIYKVLLILITMPVSTASAERSFSAMKRIKSYLRATMRQERFSGLALMHVHKTFNFDYDEAIRTFIERKKRRMILQ
ncbi:52 kDa repressor of the inhibitor of the protein kinase [Magallana gigas]|uniref:52 kDa repressor of the inhibitor of the protein kinase n=1 Tax=Magallana gigas TaxID=29159 RepID=UPI00333ED957